MISLRFIGIIGIVIVAVSTISESSTTKRPAKKSGLCPQPNCKMNVNCARSNDCCALDGSKFCVPAPCPETRFCTDDFDCPKTEKCCRANSNRTVCTHAVFVV